MCRHHSSVKKRDRDEWTASQTPHERQHAAVEESIAEIARAIRETEDASTGRTVIPFRVRAAGASFLGFEELGLQIPRAPDEILD